MTSTFILCVCLVILFPCVATAPADSQCYHGWVKHHRSCYGFGEDLVTWAGASSLCQIFGGELAEINDRDEDNFLKEYARNHSDSGVWIGGTDVLSEGYWVWSGSKTPLADGFTDWGPGEPNHSGGETNEDCLQLLVGLSYRWNDAECGLSFPFVCEIHLD